MSYNKSRNFSVPCITLSFSGNDAVEFDQYIDNGSEINEALINTSIDGH